VNRAFGELFTISGTSFLKKLYTK